MKTLFLFILIVGFGVKAHSQSGANSNAPSEQLRILTGQYCGGYRVCVVEQERPALEFISEGRMIRAEVSHLAHNFVTLRNMQIVNGQNRTPFTIADSGNQRLMNAICSHFGRGFRSAGTVPNRRRGELHSLSCLHGRNEPNFERAHRSFVTKGPGAQTAEERARNSGVGQAVEAAGRAIQPGVR